MPIDWDTLFKIAEAARTRAYAPYSKFQVGAALLAESGKVLPGCNVENASYGLTICAERNAIGNLALDGSRLLACAIVVDSAEPTPPCGMCRQVLSEFGNPELEVRSRTLSGLEARYTIAELLPHAFTKRFL